MPEDVFKKAVALPREKSETKMRVKWIKDRLTEAIRDGLVEKTPRPYRFLDIGGGTGVFAYTFKDKLWLPHVIDPDQNSGFIKTKLRIPLKQILYRPGIFPHKFNLISLIYVLEHIVNPLKFLKTIRTDMLDEAFLFIEVPDSIAFSIKPKHDDIFNSTHLWMFDPKTLTGLLDHSGFKILYINRLKTIRGNFALMALAKQK
mgnify:FL=1